MITIITIIRTLNTTNSSNKAFAVLAVQPAALQSILSKNSFTDVETRT